MIQLFLLNEPFFAMEPRGLHRRWADIWETIADLDHEKRGQAA